MAIRKRLKLSQTKLRAAVTNGSAILHSVDHRSAWMRRLRDLYEGHLSDLGGERHVSHSEKVLVRRAAMLTLQVEMMEQQWATANDGEASPRQIESYQRCSNTLRRLLESLGLHRRPRDVTPRLTDILRGEAAE